MDKIVKKPRKIEESRFGEIEFEVSEIPFVGDPRAFSKQEYCLFFESLKTRQDLLESHRIKRKYW
jgi:hypothetical protein